MAIQWWVEQPATSCPFRCRLRWQNCRFACCLRLRLLAPCMLLLPALVIQLQRQFESRHSQPHAAAQTLPFAYHSPRHALLADPQVTAVQAPPSPPSTTPPAPDMFAMHAGITPDIFYSQLDGTQVSILESGLLNAVRCGLGWAGNRV